MSRNNDVFQILVTKGNEPVLPADSKLEDLKPGQIGVFNSNTNLSIDGSSPVKEFFLAVGVDRDGDGVTEAINTSAGQVIQTRNVRFYDFRPHTAPKPMILELSDYKANCDTDYAVRLEFRNQEIYRRQGYNQFTHTYAVRTACCEDCADCPSGDMNEITKLMMEAMNTDEYGLVTAEAIAVDALTIATHGTSADYAVGAVIPLEEFDAIIAFNAVQPDDTTKVSTKIRMTTNAVAVNNFCSINLKYYHPRQTVIIPSLVEGFNCTGKATITQEAAFEEGSGYDVKQKEYHAGGWNGKPGPYRVSTATGLSKEEFEYFADPKVKYDQLALTYDQFSVGGWQEYLNHLATEIAIPADETTTRDSLVAVLDAIVGPSGFDALSDDAASADVDPTVTEATSDKDDTALDGIG